MSSNGIVYTLIRVSHHFDINIIPILQLNWLKVVVLYENFWYTTMLNQNSNKRKKNIFILRINFQG